MSDGSASRPRRWQHALALALLLALPLAVLGPCLFGDRSYVPWDIAQFAPQATTMTEGELAAVRKNNYTDVTEIPAMFVPELRFLRSELAQGRFPHWNPYSRAGTPAWSPSILGPWYPLNWAVLMRSDPQDGLALGAFFSMAIAALLMYGLLVHLGLSVPAALFGTLVFAASGTHMANLHFYQRINALIWLPGMLWAISTLAQRDGFRRIPALLGLAVCMFATHTAGFPPYALVSSLIAGAFAAWVVLRDLRRRTFRATLGWTTWVGSGALLGVMLAAVQSVPMFAFFPESNRTMNPSPNNLATNAFDPAGFLGYFCPTIFTHPHVNVVGGLRDQFSPLFWTLFSRSAWQDEGALTAGTILTPNLNFCEYTVFAGTATVFLAVAGLLARRTPLRWFALLGFTISLTFATAPRFAASILELPLLRLIPPQRYMGSAVLFLAILAAAGVHDLRNLRAGTRNLLWVVALAATLLFGTVGFWANSLEPAELLARFLPELEAKHAARYPEVPAGEFQKYLTQYLGADMPLARRHMALNLLTAAVACAFCGLLFFFLPRLLRARFGYAAVFTATIFLTGWELYSFGAPLNTGRTLVARPLNDTPVHRFLQQERDRHASTGGFAVLRAHDTQKGTRMVTLPSQLPPDTLLNEHIRDWQAYTFVDGRSHKPFVELYGPEQLARDIWPLSVRDTDALLLPFWDMIGVRFILSEDPLQFAGKRVGPQLEGPTGRAFHIYERETALPRAWVVHQATAVPDNGADPDAALVRRIVAKEFRPAVEALVDSETAKRLPDLSKTAPQDRKPRMVTFPVSGETSTLTIDVAAGAPGLLVMNDTFMGGWTATVDGESVPLHRANLFQRMVAIPAKSVRVKLAYVTPGFYVGLALSALGWFLVLTLGFVFLRRRRTAMARPASDSKVS